MGPTGAAGPTAIVASESQPDRRDRLESIVIWLCCIFVAVGSVLLIAAGREVRQMVGELSISQAQIRMLQERVAKIEKDAQKLRSAVESASVAPLVTHSTLTFTNEEERVVRQYIKVLPPQSPVGTSIQLGQTLGTLNMAPIPDGIVDQIPRLAGARFSIDPSGAIIINRSGSSRVDAILNYSK